MIKLQRITTSDTELYQYVEQLVTESFPLDEYRPLDQWRILTDKNDLFQNNAILSDGKPVGLLTYWDLGNFYYIEHFAIDEKLRNNGYGKEVLTLLEKEIDKPLILEVERPDNEIAQRRIGFYKRYKFELWNEPYVQPPYRPDGSAVPMLIMCRGPLTPSKDYKEVKRKLYQEAYNLNLDTKF